MFGLGCGPDRYVGSQPFNRTQKLLIVKRQCRHTRIRALVNTCTISQSTETFHCIQSNVSFLPGVFFSVFPYYTALQKYSSPLRFFLFSCITICNLNIFFIGFRVMDINKIVQISEVKITCLKKFKTEKWCLHMCSPPLL